MRDYMHGYFFIHPSVEWYFWKNPKMQNLDNLLHAHLFSLRDKSLAQGMEALRAESAQPTSTNWGRTLVRTDLPANRNKMPSPFGAHRVLRKGTSQLAHNSFQSGRGSTTSCQCGRFLHKIIPISQRNQMEGIQVLSLQFLFCTFLEFLKFV